MYNDTQYCVMVMSWLLLLFHATFSSVRVTVEAVHCQLFCTISYITRSMYMYECTRIDALLNVHVDTSVVIFISFICVYCIVQSMYNMGQHT